MAVFPNLGADATLIVPTVIDGVKDHASYAQISYFVRSSDPALLGQQSAIWRVMADVLLDRMAGTSEPVWVSTDGGGVSHLHLRLDSEPKYYKHESFKRFESGARP